jgi:hypothetical protein
MIRRTRGGSRTPIARRTFLQLSIPASVGGLATLLYLSRRADTPPLPPAAARNPATLPVGALPTATTRPIPDRPVLLAAASPSIPTQPAAWRLAANRGTIKGFADKTSAADGEKIALFVTTPALSFDVQIFRLGWYGGGASQAQFVQTVSRLRGEVQPQPITDAKTGLISAANWTSNGTLAVTGWRSGLYLLKLMAADGDQNYIPLVVRDDVGQHDYLFEHAVTTDQAYNAWGGKSLYDYNSSGELTDGGSKAAVKVSFDRPFDGDGSGGSMLRWELNMVRWMEAEGLDVAYASDVDVHRDPQFDTRARAILQAGHSEYWSKGMRDHLESARDRGKGLGFFTGDTGSWAIRFEDSPLGPNRIEVCYRDAKDPVAASDPSRSTNHWRDAPLNRPTQQFFGIGTNGPVRRSADWIVEGLESAPELFANTGLKNGDVIPDLVGYEYDGLWTTGGQPDTPAGVRVLGRARVIPNDMPEGLLDFNVSYEFPAITEVAVGRLMATVETLAFSLAWTLSVHLVSSTGSITLVYAGGGDQDPPARFGDQIIFSLGEEFYNVGWRKVNRNLADDYRQSIGELPSDLRVQSIYLRGSLSLGTLELAAPSGQIMKLSFDNSSTPEVLGWHVVRGQGELAISPSGPSGEPVLQMRVAIPEGRRGDEAHTVSIRTSVGGLIIAAGSIQWSWALDDYGAHTDDKRNQTKVDQRMQALTRNMLLELRGG